MFGKLLIVIGLVAAGLLFVILNTIEPVDAGATGVLAVFLLLYIALLAGLTHALWLGSRALKRVGSELKLLSSYQSVTLKKAYYYATVVALAPVILIGLQSVGGAGVYEVGLVALLVTLGCIYVSRRF